MQAAVARPHSVDAEIPAPTYRSKTARLTLLQGGLAPNHRQSSGRARPMVRITFDVLDEHAPALRSAIEEISNEVGGRLEGLHRYSKEHALTKAAVALGTLRAAICKVVAAGDPTYV